MSERLNTEKWFHLEGMCGALSLTRLDVTTSCYKIQMYLDICA